MKMLACLISIGYRTEALGREGTHCEWEHFKDQTFCHALRRQPDSLLLSAQRGAPWMVGGGRQRDRQPLFCMLPQFLLYVSQLRHALRPLKGLLGSADTGGSPPSICVGGCDEENRGQREKGGEGTTGEKGRTGPRRPEMRL